MEKELTDEEMQDLKEFLGRRRVKRRSEELLARLDREQAEKDRIYAERLNGFRRDPDSATLLDLHGYIVDGLRADAGWTHDGLAFAVRELERRGKQAP